VVDELPEGIPERIQGGIAIRVIVLYDREDGNLRLKAQKRAIVFVGLDQKDVAVARSRIRPQFRDHAADNKGGIKAGCRQHRRQHRRRGRLAVSPRNGDTSPAGHELPE
jgi:hypothetical protein